MDLKSLTGGKGFFFFVFFVVGTQLPASSKAEFRVGVILPLTGSAAEYGDSMSNSIELAKQDQPRNFQNIKFLVEDSRNDAKTAVSAFQKLVLRDSVRLVYIWGVAPCAAVLPLAEVQKVPTIAQCYDKKASTGRKYVIRFMNKTEDYMNLLSTSLKEDGREKIGVILSETPYIEEMYEGFQHSLQAGQKLDLIGRFHLTETDMRVAVSKLKNSKDDSLAVFLSLGQVAAFFRQAREQQLLLPAYGTISFESALEIKNAAGAMEGVKFVGNAVEDSYRDKYRKTFSTESQLSFGALSYEFSRLVGELFAEDVDRSAEAILAGFHLPAERKGVAVPWMRYVTEGAIDEGRHFEFPLELRRVRGVGTERALSERR